MNGESSTGEKGISFPPSSIKNKGKSNLPHFCLKNKISLVLEITLVFICNALGQPIHWFDDLSIRNTVLLEKLEKGEFKPHGTGFLNYNYKNETRPIIVTCAHLLKGSEIYVKVPADSELILCMKGDNDSITMGESTWKLQNNNLRLRVKLTKNRTYVTHPDTSLDIAAFPIGLWTSADTKKGHLKFTKTTMMSKSYTRTRSDIFLGDEVYFVGFPFGIGTQGTLTPLVRSGSIAWLSNESKIFLLDAFSYPGNSGSAIYTKMKLQDSYSCLVGMILGHLGTDSENWGLARCVWFDDILPIVQRAENL
jgi:hypothetical protein